MFSHFIMDEAGYLAPRRLRGPGQSRSLPPSYFITISQLRKLPVVALLAWQFRSAGDGGASVGFGKDALTGLEVSKSDSLSFYNFNATCKRIHFASHHLLLALLPGLFLRTPRPVSRMLCNRPSCNTFDFESLSGIENQIDLEKTTSSGRSCGVEELGAVLLMLMSEKLA
jgi:hypothetical protein